MLLVARGSLFGQAFVRVDLKMVTVIKAIASLTMSVSKTEILLNIIKYKTEIYNCFHERWCSEHFPSDAGGGSDLCEVLKPSLRLEMDFSESLLPLPSQDLENSCGLEKANGQYWQIWWEQASRICVRVYIIRSVRSDLGSDRSWDWHIVRWSSSNGNFYLK